MNKLKSFFIHFFVPSENNNYRARTLHHDFLTYYFLIALVFSFSLSKFTGNFKNVLGFATDITVEKLFQLTNQEREKYHLVPLTYNQELATAASLKAKDMFAKNYWNHYSPTGQTPWDFIMNAGYHYEYAGENLAKNFLFSQAVVDAWMNSQTHQENILKQNYTEVGFAIVNGVLNGEETTLAVQMFGKPMINSPIKGVEAKEPVTVKSENLQIPKQVAKQSKKINIFSFSLDFTYIFIFFLIIILLSDFYFAAKLNIFRIHGKNIAHLIFLITLLISISLIIIKSGSII